MRHHRVSRVKERHVLLGLVATASVVMAFIWSLGLARAAEGPGFALETALGAEDAPVTIIEYASMSCSHCALFHTTTFPALKKKYIDTGKVRFVFRDFPLDGAAIHASMLARCTGPERFFGFVKILFERQQSWLNQDYMEHLKRYAKLGGIGSEAFEACVTNQELGQFILKGRQEAVDKYKISATPSFVIDGEIYAGALPMADFDRILADILPSS